MITYNVKIPNKLRIRLSKYNRDIAIRQFVNETGNDVLSLVKAYGVGTGGGNLNPTGGSPVWQGEVRSGHHRGYLSDSHYIKYISPTHIQIVSSAGFAWGVLTGQSTNWMNKDGGYVRFPQNPYHKRAVDKLYRSGNIQTNWKRATKGSIV